MRRLADHLNLRFDRLPVLVRFMMAHAALGFTLAAAFVVGLHVIDPGGFGTLLRQAGGHPWPSLLLWYFSGLTFGSVQMGAAVMLLADHHQDGSGGSKVRPLPPLLAALALPVRSKR